MWKYLSSEGINIFNVVDIFSRRGPHHCKVIKVSVSQLMSPTSDTNDHFLNAVMSYYLVNLLALQLLMYATCRHLFESMGLILNHCCDTIGE